MALARVSKAGSGALNEIIIGVKLYLANEGRLMLPKSLLDNFTTIQLLTDTTGTDFSSIDSGVLTTIDYYPDTQDTNTSTLTSTPVAINTITYTNYIVFKNANEGSMKYLFVKLSN